MSDLTWMESRWCGEGHWFRWGGTQDATARPRGARRGWIPLALVQDGEHLGMPHSRSMPSIGPRCHELRINDREQTCRLIYPLDSDAVVVLEVFSKKSR